MKNTAWNKTKEVAPPNHIEVVVKDKLGNLFIGEVRVGSGGVPFWVVKGSDLMTAPLSEYPVWCAVPL